MLISDHYWLSETQLERIKSYFPRSHGVPRVDDRRVLSGIIHVLKRDLQWRDIPDWWLAAILCRGGIYSRSGPWCPPIGPDVLHGSGSRSHPNHISRHAAYDTHKLCRCLPMHPWSIRLACFLFQPPYFSALSCINLGVFGWLGKLHFPHV